MFTEFKFDGRAMAALERLTIGTGFSIFSQTDFATFYSNLQHFGERLAKLEVSARAVARSLEIYQQLIDPYLEKLFPTNRLPEMSAAMETLSWATYVAVSAAHSDAQKIEAETLLSVLDAELSAENLDILLDRVLKTATYTFNANLGLILMCDTEQQLLRIESQFGFAEDSEDLAKTTSIGEGFAGKIAATGEPAILPDLRAASPDGLHPILKDRALALWGVPLRSKEKVIGVLVIGFSKPLDWLPTERNLLRAIADRSALAIDRAGMTDALREREMRIAELSGHLMHAQEEERKRISRELHDETGQALMVIRLYLGMLETTVTRTRRQSENSRDPRRRRSHDRRHSPHHRAAFAAGLAGAGADRGGAQGSQRSGQERGGQGEGQRVAGVRTPAGCGGGRVLSRGAGGAAQRRQACECDHGKHRDEA